MWKCLHRIGSWVVCKFSMSVNSVSEKKNNHNTATAACWGNQVGALSSSSSGVLLCLRFSQVISDIERLQGMKDV